MNAMNTTKSKPINIRLCIYSLSLFALLGLAMSFFIGCTVNDTTLADTTAFDNLVTTSSPTIMPASSAKPLQYNQCIITRYDGEQALSILSYSINPETRTISLTTTDSNDYLLPLDMCILTNAHS